MSDRDIYIAPHLSLLGVKGGPAIQPGSNMPTANLIRMGGKTVLVDAGLGVSRGIVDQTVLLRDIDLIVITHLHSDHYLELGPLVHTAWTAGLARTIPVIGPKGLDAYWEAFQASMDFDIALRLEDEGRPPFAPLLDIQEIAEGEIWTNGPKIRALRNHHPPIKDSFALRFEAPEGVVVISGDTAPIPEMVGFARGADILLHEAMHVPGVHRLAELNPHWDPRVKEHILRSHSAAEDVGQIARDAGVGTLALTHRVPDRIPGLSDADWTAAVRTTWTGPLHLGNDGDQLWCDGRIQSLSR